MSTAKIIRPFFDLQKKGTSEASFFFLEHVLRARADLHMESGKHEFDQEINVYVAGLLNSLMESGNLLRQKPYISAFDIDVREWLEQHPGRRNEYVVYRDNADFGLVLMGLFLGYHHRGSYQHRVIPDTDEKGRIAIYYELAASALAHLQGNSASLVNVLLSIAECLPEILQILRKAADSYFDLMARLSDGSMYHLERELESAGKQKEYELKVDEFLKQYAAYKDNPTEELRGAVMALAEKLREMNQNFRFDVLG